MNFDRNAPHQKNAEQAANAIAEVIADAASFYREPPQRLTFLLSTTLPGLMGAIQGSCKDATERNFSPNNDHLLFVCLLVANVTSRVRGGGENGDSVGYMVEYSIDNIVKTLEMFQELTGRSFEPMMNESLLAVVNGCRNEAKAAFSGDLNKFSPQ